MNRSILLGLFLCLLLGQSSMFSQNNKVYLNDAQVASILVIANKKVLLNENQRLLGELLITKENLVSGNNSIWAITGSIVIHKVKLKQEEPKKNDDNNNNFQPYSGWDYFMKSFSDSAFRNNIKETSAPKIESIIEFEEAILRTKSKKGVGSSLDTAINAIIDSIGPDDITITN